MTAQTPESAERPRETREELEARQAAHRERIAALRAEAEQARTEKEAASRRQAAAIAEFGLLVVNSGPGQPWDAFQCDEIDTLAELLVTFGLTGAAEVVLDEHSAADTEPSDGHHDRYLSYHVPLESSGDVEQVA